MSWMRATMSPTLPSPVDGGGVGGDVPQGLARSDGHDLDLLDARLVGGDRASSKPDAEGEGEQHADARRPRAGHAR